MLFFRSRKYVTTFDTSFFIVDGRDHFEPDTWNAGDLVELTWPCSWQQAEAINELGQPHLRAYAGGIGEVIGAAPETQEWSVRIPFRVVQRTHSLHLDRQRAGTLRRGDTSIVLEAESGHWEDVFAWLCLGQRPEWVPAAENDEAP